MTSKKFLLKTIFHAICFVAFAINSNAQCTEANEPDMAKYRKLTETQDAQGCSQCAMLALYFCSAKYSVEQSDISKVRASIIACKSNIRSMGQPYCCPELLNKEPQWGISAANTGNNAANSFLGGSSSSNAKAQMVQGIAQTGIALGSRISADIARDREIRERNEAKRRERIQEGKNQVNNNYSNALKGDDNAIRNVVQGYDKMEDKEAKIKFLTSMAFKNNVARQELINVHSRTMAAIKLEYKRYNNKGIIFSILGPSLIVGGIKGSEAILNADGSDGLYYAVGVGVTIGGIVMSIAGLINLLWAGQGPMVDQEYVKAKKGLNDLGIKTSFSPIPLNNGKMGNMISYGITYNF